MKNETFEQYKTRLTADKTELEAEKARLELAGKDTTKVTEKLNTINEKLTTRRAAMPFDTLAAREQYIADVAANNTNSTQIEYKVK